MLYPFLLGRRFHMSYPVPRDLKGEERLFVIPQFNIPVYKKSILYNGPATLVALLIGKVIGNQILLDRKSVV